MLYSAGVGLQNKKILDVFVQLRADAQEIWDTDKTYMYLVAQYGCPDTMKYFESIGSNVSEKYDIGMTPLNLPIKGSRQHKSCRKFGG